MEDVTIRPLPPKPTLFRESADEQPALPSDPPVAQVFIPPQPERPAVRPPRMPRVEDLPVPAQNEIRASRGEAAEPNQEKRRTSLLQRLASVGLGRRDDEPEAPAQARPVQRSAPPHAPNRLPPRSDDSRGPDPVSEYAKRPAPPRPAPQGLDPLGRPAPVHNSIDDDQLEIPAFLRRQAN